MTYESDLAGILAIVASEGDTLAVGEVIAHVGAGSGGDGSPGVAAGVAGGDAPSTTGRRARCDDELASAARALEHGCDFLFGGVGRRSRASA